MGEINLKTAVHVGCNKRNALHQVEQHTAQCASLIDALRVDALRLIRVGDWLVLLLCMIATAWLFATLWQGHTADKAIVRSGGKVVAELSLMENRSYLAHGPLGNSRIEIHNRRARVAEDPSPRQYCVKQGWLSQAGEAALCLPNQISLELTGAKKLYDSLSY